jgi:hypothetical protein
MKFLEDFGDAAINRINEFKIECSNQLLTGSCPDYATYKYLCGKLHTYDEVIKSVHKVYADWININPLEEPSSKKNKSRNEVPLND